MATIESDLSETLITLTSDIVAAHVSNNSVSVDDVPSLIQNVYGALAGLGSVPQPEEKLQPAVSVRASVKSDHLVCLEDGKKMKMLKRHLMTDHGLTPAEYRARWNLPADYPMVAPDYAEKRRVLAKETGTPIRDAEVTLTQDSVSVRTDSTGAFRLVGLRAGPHPVLIRAIGYTELAFTATLREGSDSQFDVQLDAIPGAAQALAPVEVTTLAAPRLR